MCIVDMDFVKNVMQGRQVLGSTVMLDGYQYKIIGIEKKDNSLMSYYMDTSNLDGSVIIPYRNALTMSGAANVTSLDVYIADGRWNRISGECSIISITERTMPTVSSIWKV